jgi:hypothetical protein
MSQFVLSIIVYGLGTDPNHRSHWALAIHRPDEQNGVVLQVIPIELSRLIYQFDLRRDVLLCNKSSEGSFIVATLDHSRRAEELIREEPAPRDGVERCQDWVLRAIISLEAEEIVPAGTSEWISGLVGRPAENVAHTVSARWTPTES